ncbi:MAG: response regulator transcription factor [Chloroflexi bacterium]|nr:response regulator transcription factor [Chloroflexota bacterium]
MSTATTARPITVLVVDDHELARQGVRQFLKPSRHIKVVGEAANTSEAIRLMSQLQPSVVLLDIRLGQGSGLDVARAAKASAPDTKVLVLSAYDDRQYVSRSKRLGVAGYLMKGLSPEELSRAVEDTVHGRPTSAREVADKVSGHATPHWGTTQRVPQRRELTVRESEVLELMLQGLRNRAIAAALGISVKTVETHVEHILLKLEAASRTEAVLAAIKGGWLEEAVS